MKPKWEIAYLLFFFLASNTTIFGMESDPEMDMPKGQNIAVFPGGALPCLISLKFAAYFENFANQPFCELFRQAWSISGGTIVATFLMTGKYKGDEAVEKFRKTVGQAFPNKIEFLDAYDFFGNRRTKFESELRNYFGDLKFETDNRLVYIASNQNNQPVYFCNPDLELNPAALRCKEGSSCIDGIVGSCCYIHNFNVSIPIIGGVYNLHLFQQKKMKLLPLNEEQNIYDGALCAPMVEGKKYILDGYTPTPLVIEYLKKIPGKHNVVVFGNGGPHNEEYRRSIDMINNIAIIKTEISIIKVFMLHVEVKNFGESAMDNSPEHLKYLTEQVAAAISLDAGNVLEQALHAVVEN